MIRAVNISASKGGTTILKKVSFELAVGEICVLVGKNGAGKSTLLESVTGVLDLDEGMILWDNTQSTDLNSKNLALRRAVLSQQVKLNFPIKVRDLVEMGIYVLEHPPIQVEIDRLIDEALSEVEMLDFSDREFNTLSGGEQKRVLLAKAVLQLNCCKEKHVKQYLFLDEPTANLDIQQQYNLIKWVRKLAKKRKIGIFAILHDVNLAAQLADKVLMMKNGEIIVTGSPDEVFTPVVLSQILGIHAIVQPHPVFGCPNIIPLANKPEEITLNSIA